MDDILTRHGFRVAVMKTEALAPERMEAWVADKVKQDIDVLICHMEGASNPAGRKLLGPIQGCPTNSPISLPPTEKFAVQYAPAHHFRHQRAALRMSPSPLQKVKGAGS